MAINPINSLNFFEAKKTPSYTPAAIPSSGEGIGAKKGANPFAQSMNDVQQIALEKAQGANVGLGGTNNPTETLGNRLMIAA